MAEQRDWQAELGAYIKQGEANEARRSDSWRTAIGLQDVDGLKTSEYLLDTAKEHIEGRITMEDAQNRIHGYYEQSAQRAQIERDTMEADIVSTRIAALLCEDAFRFSPAEYKEIHRRLFTGVFDHAGTFRKYNISKKEWVLGGNSVIYASFDSILPTLEYDFKTEREFSYEGLSVDASVKHIAKFASDIWQIHPFCEGNTRTTAVFIIKYLRSFGFRVQNDQFAAHSWYFRNALVRANYNDLNAGITATTEYLERFFENLLLGKKHELKNRFLHIGFQSAIQSATDAVSKCKNCTLEELAVLEILSESPHITQKELAKRMGKSERTIKAKTVSLQEKGLLRRVNGKRNGAWEVLTDPEQA